MEEDKDFGEILYELRRKKGLSIIELLEKIGKKEIKEKNIRKWESGLEYPELEIIYKLSEIYCVPSTVLLKAKQDSLKSGVDNINKRFIKWLSFTLGISIYASIILSRIIIYGILIIVFIWFCSIGG